MITMTARQHQVAQGLALGKSNAEIATELGIAHATVRCHVQCVLRALNVVNRTGAAIAMRGAKIKVLPPLNYDNPQPRRGPKRLSQRQLAEMSDLPDTPPEDGYGRGKIALDCWR